MAEPRVTIKIPRAIYERIRVLTERSSFSSVTDFIVYVLRDLLSEQGDGRRAEPAPEDPERGDPLTAEEIRAVRRRLRSLGYF